MRGSHLVAINVSDEDIRHIRISCRCGEKFIAEIPEQLCHALHVHLCPGCQAMFGIQKLDEGWKIRRVDLDNPGMVMQRLKEKDEPPKSSGGMVN